MMLESKYTFGQILYLKTDVDQLPRIVTEIKYQPNGVLYQLSCGTTASDHYEFEVSEEKNILVEV